MFLGHKRNRLRSQVYLTLLSRYCKHCINDLGEAKGKNKHKRKKYA